MYIYMRKQKIHVYLYEKAYNTCMYMRKHIIHVYLYEKAKNTCIFIWESKKYMHV